MTFYRRPMPLTQMMNRFVSWFTSMGLTPSRMITLEVKGRRTGEVRWNPLNVVEHEGQRYLVSPRGESEWVRNLRAAGGEAVIRHGRREKVRLEEIAAEERAPITAVSVRVDNHIGTVMVRGGEAELLPYAKALAAALAEKLATAP